MQTSIFTGTIWIAALLIFLALPVHAAENDRHFPERIDPSKRYLFYLHGRYVEIHGPHADYRYYDILDALEGKGFVVIGEARDDVRMGAYANKIAGEARRLLEAGVPASSITIAGHSRGGFMALLAASRLGEPDIRYGILAACGRKGSNFYRAYKRLQKEAAPQLRGHFLVMWDEEDTVAADCDAAMKIAGSVTYKNRMLTAGGGHRLFYEPQSSWIDPLAAFARN